MIVCRHLRDVTCQWRTVPSALATSSRFFVFDVALAGRKRRHVTGSFSAVGLASSYASRPSPACSTRTVPSPLPAATSASSGEYRTQKTSASLPTFAAAVHTVFSATIGVADGSAAGSAAGWPVAAAHCDHRGSDIGATAAAASSAAVISGSAKLSSSPVSAPYAVS